MDEHASGSSASKGATAEPAGPLSEATYVMPFGRYVGTSEVSPPADEVLVGREGLRAYLIDLLISSGRRGAYLVTGRRGAGKTSFVQHCIGEYEASVVSRYLRSNSGKGFWDRIFMLSLWPLLLVAALLVAELNQLIVDSNAHILLVWLIVAPAAVMLLYPAVYAGVVFEAIISNRPRKPPELAAARLPRESKTPSIKAILLVLFVALLLWFVVMPRGPVRSCALFIPLICGIYFLITVWSYERPGFRAREASEVKEPTSERIRRIVAAAVALLAAAAIVTLVVLMLVRHSDELRFLWVSACSGAGLLGAGLLVKARTQWLRSEWLRQQQVLWDPHRGLRGSVEEALTSGVKWYRSVGLVLILGLAALPILELFGMLLIFVAGVLVWTLTFKWTMSPTRKGMASARSEPALVEPRRFHPYPRLVLSAKAALSILIALQLIQPVVARVLASLEPAVRALPQSAFAPLLSSLAAMSELLAAPVDFELRHQGLYWLLSLLVLTLVLNFVEHEWILRPFLRSREDRAVDPEAPLAPWDDWDDESVDSRSREVLQRRLAELTTSWAGYKTWLPVLSVRVNLGFDKLGHRQVVQAMLAGLRERYHRTFLAWNSGFANVGRLVGILVVLALASRASDNVIALASGRDGIDCMSRTWCRLLLMPLEVPLKAQPDGRDPRDRYLLLGLLPRVSPDRPRAPARTGEGAMEVSVRLTEPASERASEWRHLLEFSAKPKAGVDDVARSAAGQPSGDPNRQGTAGRPAGASTTPAKDSISIRYRVFDGILLVVAFFVGSRLLRAVPILPYRRNLRRIDDLLDSLSSRTRTTSGGHEWGPARWIHSVVFSDDQVRETEREPVDPRTVELAFLRILEDIQKGGFRFPGAARDHLSLPAPEITFVFDELDKLGTRVDPEDVSLEPGAEDREIAIIYNERERSRRLRALLSDLKNVLSSAPARFIFVGGRDLHDEWLADQTARQPLLTSIFNTEVYLPSLMLDHEDPLPWTPQSALQESRNRPRDRQPTLDARIWEYFRNQLRRAQALHERSARKRMRPFFALSTETIAYETFAPEASELTLPCLLDRATAEPIADQLAGSALLADFVRFLTHRSMGNPKRLKDLLASFVRQTGREVGTAEARWRQVPCRHVLRFGDTEIFRIQLIASIYRHLTLAFEERMLERDDKLAVSIFFLTDFIFKFHSRSFSWGNLERVDDLAHIHRLPDLRDIQEEIVDHFSERFLHRVLNGMYAFRFRSDVAREVEYLSRKAAPEMAAFNFTLDESQALKATYLNALKRESNADLLAGLGELFEFDHEFERARHYYSLAIALLDEQLLKQAGRQKHVVKEKPDQSLRKIAAILAGIDVGMETARLFLTWGEARLRLMLQIGMTYEHVRDLEKAEMEYRSARTLARSLVKACVGVEKEAAATGGEGREDDGDHEGRRGPSRSWSRLHTLKHMNIVFQPLFASAWLAEKSIGAIDTSVSLVEKALIEIRRKLPFVKRNTLEATKDLSDPSHRNFALTMSQLHNRAADLYFFKGRQPVPPSQLDEVSQCAAEWESGDDRTTDGYLLRAHYHYSVALHELRRYLWHRVESSQALKLANPEAADGRPTPSPEALSGTFMEGAWPDFFFRAVGGSVNDMAEATLGRISLFGLFRTLAVSLDPPFLKEALDPRLVRVEEQCTKWLVTNDLGTHDKVEREDAQLPDWFGKWTGNDIEEVKSDPISLVGFVGPSAEVHRLEMSLLLCLTGARYFERGGYPEDAAREHLQVCESVTRYFWWGRTIERMSALTEAEIPDSVLRGKLSAWAGDNGLQPLLDLELFGKDQLEMFWRRLTGLAVTALENADRLFRQSRFKNAIHGNTSYLIGEVVPPEALTLLCSLRLVSAPGAIADADAERLGTLAREWTQRTAEPPGEVVELLRTAIARHRYPMINRLNAIKTLIDGRLTGPVLAPGALAEATRWTEELLDLNTQFDAPFHFTPLHSGTTCALLWLRLRLLPKADRVAHELSDARIERIYRAAELDLRVSEEMYTMRRAYHEAISDLYYLYDDFNDRQIHFNHAIQMAGAELTSLWRSLLEKLGPV